MKKPTPKAKKLRKPAVRFKPDPFTLCERPSEDEVYVASLRELGVKPGEMPRPGKVRVPSLAMRLLTGLNNTQWGRSMPLHVAAEVVKAQIDALDGRCVILLEKEPIFESKAVMETAYRDPYKNGPVEGPVSLKDCFDGPGR